MSKSKEKKSSLRNVAEALKWNFTIFKKYRLRLFLMVLFVIFQRLFELYMTTRVGSIVDLALEDNVHTLIRSTAILMGMYFMNFLISLFNGRFCAYNFNDMYNHMELITYRKIMDASWSDLTDYHSGDLMTRLTSDIKNIADTTNGLLSTIVSNIIVITGAGLYLLYLDYSIILVAVLIAPIVLISSRIFMGRIYSSQKRIKEIESDIASYNKETFNNIQAVKAFGLGDVFYSRMENLEKQRMKADLRSNKYSMASWGLSFFTGVIGASVCIGWLFYRVHTGVISFGSLSVMAFLAMQVGTMLKALLHMIPTIMNYVTSTERVNKLMKLGDEEKHPLTDEEKKFLERASEEGVSVKINDMHFNYRNGYQVFEGVSLEADPGEIVALVGPSGEGKTTMLRIILGIVNACKGEVYAESSGGRMDFGKQTRALISYVPQGNTMMAGSILENMRMVKPDATVEEIEEALKKASIYDFIKTLPDGLDHRLGENSLGFSEGQNQRLSIARALLKDAPILLMDEATSALDVASERAVLNNIVKSDPRKTLILTTHRPTVLTMCDRVYHIQNKKISLFSEKDIQKLMDEF
ncbi:MAG: ABC transporter ATP-binding protein/permease [Lachnospiraceae bacterium]|nr:ABC transporter ATP-binding protein/permease [Lachnospiraceae bacterium]